MKYAKLSQIVKLTIFFLVLLVFTPIEGKLTVILTPQNVTVFTVQEQPLIPKVTNGIQGFLVNSDPEDACTPVSPPPQGDKDVSAFNLNGTNSNSSHWILIATWNNLNDSCNLLLKAKNAQDAGYSAIIIQNVLSNDSMGAISIYDWFHVNVYPCLVGSFDGKLLRENFISNEYLLKFEDEAYYSTWFAYAVAAILVFLALMAVAGLGYILTQMILLVLLWLGQIISTTIQQRRRNRRRRLPASLLKRLPTQLWTADIPQDTCSVCLENFEEGERVRVLPCSHIFHTPHCIDPWLLNQRRKCPNCQGKITFADERHESDSSTDDEQAPLLRPSSASSSSQTSRNGAPTDEVEQERQQLQDRLHAIQRILQEVAVLALIESESDQNRSASSAATTNQGPATASHQNNEPLNENTAHNPLQRLHSNQFVTPPSAATTSSRGRGSFSRKPQIHLAAENTLPQISEVEHEQDSLSSSLSHQGVGEHSCPEAEIDERMGELRQLGSTHNSAQQSSSNPNHSFPESALGNNNPSNNQNLVFTDFQVYVSQNSSMGDGAENNQSSNPSNQNDMI